METLAPVLAEWHDTLKEPHQSYKVERLDVELILNPALFRYNNIRNQ